MNKSRSFSVRNEETGNIKRYIDPSPTDRTLIMQELSAKGELIDEEIIPKVEGVDNLKLIAQEWHKRADVDFDEDDWDDDDLGFGDISFAEFFDGATDLFEELMTACSILQFHFENKTPDYPFEHREAYFDLRKAVEYFSCAMYRLSAEEE